MDTKQEVKLMQGVYDCIFKAIMLDKENRDYLRWVIHLITKIPLEELQDIKIENVEYVVNHKTDKKPRSDIIVSLEHNIINLEMNREYYKGLFYRNDKYIDKISANTYSEKEEKTIIQINFDRFNYFNGDKEIYKFIYKDEEKDIKLPETTIKYHIDLEFIKNKWYNEDALLMSKFKKYMLMLIAETDKFAERISKRTRKR